ncbi:hypothetical protein ACJ73_04493 [Blastomyces percursus]|uniref:Uncharacterized protein n=1 Tax=Blastomyces percursus TaxID=1658174 RepID=A0A1J9Q5Y9_9EURO|nr:hypothetical protein ACJ73_04493 [Blastomyces percursus]
MGFIRATKRDFWRIFKKAWEDAVTPTNIQAVFSATGIQNLNPQRVLDKIQQRPETPTEMSNQQTPTTIRANGRLSLDLQRLVHGGEMMALEREILTIENRGLRDILNNERKHRKRGKALGLADPDNPSRTQFFSPAKNEKARKEDAKLQRAILREENDAAAAERRLQHEEARKAAAQRREKDKAAKKAQRLIEKELRDSKKVQQQKKKKERAAILHQAR